MKSQKEWFEEWFDSPYYHILYKHRNDREAELFLNNLIAFLKLSTTQSIIDLACGRGRHSVFLNRLGYKVTGVDLSVQNIAYAKQFENKNLHFRVADLRNLHLPETFDVALNLFTSFGYFDCLETNNKVVKQINTLLNPNGLFIIDFFNLTTTLAGLVKHEEKEIDGVKFIINRNLQLGNIIKQIQVSSLNHSYTYYEKVQALSFKDFDEMLKTNGFRINHFFGDYHLNVFDEQSSQRLIIIAQKC
jgi:SAM-dependent methyltransferase